MANEKMLEVYRQLRTAQDKYIYFLLAVAASAVAYALNRTQTATLSWWLLPVGIAVVSWGFSFFFGCRHLSYAISALFANGELLKAQSGEHPLAGMHPEKIQIAREYFVKEISSNSNKSHFYAQMQFIFVVFGAVAYIAWHVLEMWRRTN